ncbi:MAG: DinB family protein [Pirellulales bacterium]
MDRALIEQYAAGATQPAEAIAGLAREELNAFPVPGTWSIQQIVVHLMDSDLIGADRMKRVAAEDKPPTLIGYDESAFARGLFYDQLDPRLACEVFEKNRLLTAEVLRRLPAAAFERTGNHNEHGTMTLAELLENYVGHLNHHLKFIREKRKLLGR